MYQCGPEWHMLQTHWIRVDSDFRRLKEWWQYDGTAMVTKGDVALERWAERVWVGVSAEVCLGRGRGGVYSVCM